MHILAVIVRITGRSYVMRIQPMLPALLAVLLCAAAFGAPAPEDVAQDAIDMIGPGSLSNIKVNQDTWIVVEAQKFQVKTPIPAYKVKTVVYASAPELYRVAQQAAEEGDYEKALKALILTLKKDGEKYAWFKQYLFYDIARYYVKRRAEGDYEKARGYLDQLMTEVKDSRFLPDALLLYADTCFMEGKDFEAARKAYEKAREQLTAMSRQVSGPHVEYLEERALTADYKVGECLSLLKRYGEAKSVYSGVAARSRKYPRVLYLALLGGAQALWQEGQVDEALKAFAELIEKAEIAGTRDILAGAYAGLGDCYFGKKDFEVARWNYLKVAVQFFDNEEYAAKSLYRVGLCYKEIMLAEQDDKKRAEAKKQVQFYLNEVISNYSGFWADQAKEAKNTL